MWGGGLCTAKKALCTAGRRGRLKGGEVAAASASSAEEVDDCTSGGQHESRKGREEGRTGGGKEETNGETDRDLDQTCRCREACVRVTRLRHVVACELEQAAVAQSTGELKQYAGEQGGISESSERAKKRNSPDDHDDERRSMSELAVDVPEKANDKGPDGGTDVGAADKDLAREVVTREPCPAKTVSELVSFARGRGRTGATDQNHDDRLSAEEGLAVPQTQHEEVARDREEDWKRSATASAAFDGNPEKEHVQNQGGMTALYHGALTRNAEHV